MVAPARFFTVLSLAAITVAACTLAVSAQQSPGAADLLQAGDVLMAGSHYGDALRVYRRARETDDVDVRVRAGAGAVRSLLRLGLFRDGAREGAEVAARDPSNAAAIAVHGDALWAFGRFPEAEARYAAALDLDPQDPGALHGRGRAEAARLQFEPALADVTRAVSLDPLEPSYQVLARADLRADAPVREGRRRAQQVRGPAAEA